MDIYHFMLYVHFLALVAGAIASGLTHFSMSQVEHARTGDEALRWLGVLKRTTKVFPAALLGFFVSGGYMVSKLWTWSMPFVAVGAVGAVLLLVNGIIMGTQAKLLPPLLLQARDRAVPDQAKAIIFGPIVSTLPWVNTFLVFGIMFVMTMKPSLAGSVTAMLVAVAVGFIVANRVTASSLNRSRLQSSVATQS